MAPKIEATLAERGTRYGDYAEHARITQNIKRAMQDSPNWAGLPDDMREALEMIAHKAGRILNGDPEYHDSWHDIIGYTKLVADRLVVELVPVHHAEEAPMPPHDSGIGQALAEAQFEAACSGPVLNHAGGDIAE